MEEQDLEKLQRASIMQFMKELELKNKIDIIYATETGSRAYGTHVSNSDFDVKGFYTCSKKRYLSIKGVPEFVDSQHVKLKIGGLEYDVDFEFYDIKSFFKRRIESFYKPVLNTRFFANQDKVYINLFPKKDFEFLRQKAYLESEVWRSIIKGYHKQFFYTKTGFIKKLKEKHQDNQNNSSENENDNDEINQKQEKQQEQPIKDKHGNLIIDQKDKFYRKIRAKDMVNCFVFSCQFLYILENKTTFPPTNYKILFEEVKKIEKYSKYFPMIENQFQKYFEMKKKDRVCYVSEQDFDEELTEFLHEIYKIGMETGYKKYDKNKPVIIEFTEDEAETVFNNILDHLYKD